MTNYTSMEQLPITLSANQLAQVLGIYKMRWPEGIHAKDVSVLRKYAKERLNYLDLAINDFDYFEE